MNILITGTSGFIGGRFLQLITQNGWFKDEEIYILSSQHISANNYNVIQYSNYNIEASILPDVVFDVVFHIGAFTPKTIAESNKVEKATSNITFTNSLLASLSGRCKKLIFLSTLDVYSPQFELVDENTPISPISLYGHSKHYCEKLVEAWAHEEACAFQTLRIGHIYGPGEEAYKKILPLSIQKLLNGEKPAIWGTGSEKRAFLYIDDCVRFIYKAALLDEFKGPINIASNHAVSVKELVTLLIELVGFATEAEFIVSGNKTRSISFNTDKLNRLLGKEQISLYDGLIQEINYFKTLNASK